MAGKLLSNLAVGAALISVVYQLFVKEILVSTVGMYRVMQDIDDFPYTCRRLVHPKFEACEDLWLDDEGRTVYAACAGTNSRLAWNPAMGKLNASGRNPAGDHILVLSADNPGSDGLFNFKTIQPDSSYTGTNGDGKLNLVGFDGSTAAGSNKIRFATTNGRPPISSTGQLLDATKIGDNATIEEFEYEKGSSSLKHLRTISTPLIYAANRVTYASDGGLLITNDHSTKIGIRRELDPIIGGGNVVYCPPSAPSGESTAPCKIAHSKGFKFPNGLTFHHPSSRLLVPSAFLGQIWYFDFNKDTATLTPAGTIKINMPSDNLAVDANGDIYVAAFPKALEMVASTEDPWNINPPATIFRIRPVPWAIGKAQGKPEYEVTKVLEDKVGLIVSGVTTVRHDVRTGRLWMGGAMSPFLVVCDIRLDA